jgi:hypothetical protein
MLHAFLINLWAFSCLGVLVCWARYSVELMHREVEEAHALESLLDAAPKSEVGAKPAQRGSLQ